MSAAVGYVYAVECGDAVKIGWAADPVRRKSELNVGAPTEHKLLGYVVATPWQERELHQLLISQRIRGEWFRKAGMVVKFLELLPSPKADDEKRMSAPRRSIKARINTKFEAYLAKANLSTTEFADQIGVTSEAVRLWAVGDRTPKPSVMRKIVDKTGGAVMPDDFLVMDEAAE